MFWVSFGEWRRHAGGGGRRLRIPALGGTSAAIAGSRSRSCVHKWLTTARSTGHNLLVPKKYVQHATLPRTARGKHAPYPPAPPPRPPIRGHPQGPAPPSPPSSDNSPPSSATAPPHPTTATDVATCCGRVLRLGRAIGWHPSRRQGGGEGRQRARRGKPPPPPRRRPTRQRPTPTPAASAGPPSRRVGPTGRQRLTRAR